MSLDAGIEFTLSLSPFTHSHTHTHTHNTHTVSWPVYWFQIIGQRDTNQMLEELGESKHLVYYTLQPQDFPV